jgi:radical SAM superfamily enzyme YgiQ (UPF0313 family)
MKFESDLLLINAFSWTEEKRACYLPYGILYLAGYMRDKGINISIYDRNTDYSLDIEKCIDFFRQKRPKIVGLSVLTGPVINDALSISRRIKSIAPETCIVWGGLHPTIFPQYVLNEDSVDFIVQGEGEEAIYELCDAILNNKGFEAIQNIGYKKNRKANLNPMRPNLLNLDESPLPAWDLLNMKHYTANRFFASRVVTMNTSRGCLFKCSFCFNQGLPHQKWRGLSAKNILNQINYLYKHYNINGIQFYEDSFDTNKKRVSEFSDLMIQSGLNFKIKWSHFSNIPYFNENLVSCEKKAGLRYIEYGVESGCQRILDWINKRQTVQHIKEVFKKCDEIGIKTAALFMIGFPDETEEELKMTVNLVEDLQAHILICTIYRPYPGTPLFDYCVKNKNFKPPEKLEEQGEFYRFSHMKKDELNLSRVPTEKLLNLQKSFYAKFAIKEAALCFKELNLGLLIYYIKQQLYPSNFLYFLRSMFVRLFFIMKKREAR